MYIQLAISMWMTQRVKFIIKIDIYIMDGMPHGGVHVIIFILPNANHSICLALGSKQHIKSTIINEWQYK